MQSDGSSLSPVPILSQTSPIHTFQSYFPKIQSNIIFPSMRWSSE